LIDAVPERDRALWATALYAGLRRGELQALRRRDVDFDAGVIRVERSWDDRAGPVAPKSRAGRRRAPLAKPLRAYLAPHCLPDAAEADKLVFGAGGRGHSVPRRLYVARVPLGVRRSSRRSASTSAGIRTPRS
jgi:integrase